MIFFFKINFWQKETPPSNSKSTTGACCLHFQCIEHVDIHHLTTMEHVHIKWVELVIMPTLHSHEEITYYRVGIIPVAKLPSCQYMKSIAS